MKAHVIKEPPERRAPASHASSEHEHVMPFNIRHLAQEEPHLVRRSVDGSESGLDLGGQGILLRGRQQVRRTNHHSSHNLV